MAEKTVPYQVDGRQLEGVIVCDDSVKAKRPLIFMQPDWKGVCADTIGQARTVAGKDYVVLMADMFGAGYGPAIDASFAAAKQKSHADHRHVRNQEPLQLLATGHRYSDWGDGRQSGHSG